MAEEIIYIDEITDSKELMQAREPAIIRWFLIVLAALFLCILLFLAFFNKDISVTAVGVIEPSSPTESIATIAGGKISKVKVVDGQEVRAGDVLLEFDVAYSQEQLRIVEAGLSKVDSTLSSLDLLKQSIQDEVNLLALDDPYYYRYEEYSAERSVAIAQTNREDASAQMNSEGTREAVSLYVSRIENLKQQKTEYERLRNAIQNNESFVSSNMLVQSQYSLYQNEYSLQRQACSDADYLLAQAETRLTMGEISPTDYEMYRSASESAHSQLSTIVAKYIAEAQTNYESLSRQIESYEDQVAQQSGQGSVPSSSKTLSATLEQIRAQGLSAVQTEIEASLEEKSSLDSQRLELLSVIESGFIASERDGIVMFAAALTEGAVFSPGDILLNVIVKDESLKVIMSVNESDIANIERGQPFLLSINALPYQQYGRVNGTISYISATSLLNEQDGQYYYRVEGLLQETNLASKGESKLIQPGMAVRADIVSGSESWMSWILREMNLSDT